MHESHIQQASNGLGRGINQNSAVSTSFSLNLELLSQRQRYRDVLLVQRLLLQRTTSFLDACSSVRQHVAPMTQHVP